MTIREQVILEGVNKTDAAFRGVKKNLSGVENSSKRLGSSFSSLQKTLVGVGAALATGAFAKSLVGTITRFEDLRTSLSAVTGSLEKGSKAFDFVTKFATKTQFSVEDLSRTFIKLKASGIEPTEQLLTTFTDTAAITTDQVGTLEAMTDLFARTVSGGLGLEELNRLADRGVPVFRILEEQLGITRLEISAFGKTAEGAAKITDALGKGIQKEYGGATAKVVGNLSTQFSNLGIASRNAQDAIGQGGLTDALKDVTKGMIEAVEANKEFFTSVGSALGSAVTGTAKAFGFLADNIRILKAIGVGAIGFFGAKAFGALAVAIRGATIATLAFNKAFRRNIIGILIAGTAAALEFFGIFDKLFDKLGSPPDPADTLMQGLMRITDQFGKLDKSSGVAFENLQDEAFSYRIQIKELIKDNEELLKSESDKLFALEYGTDEYLKQAQVVEDLKSQQQALKDSLDAYWKALLSVPMEEIVLTDINDVLKDQKLLFDELANKQIADYTKSLGDSSKVFKAILTDSQKLTQDFRKQKALLEKAVDMRIISEEEANDRILKSREALNEKLTKLAEETAKADRVRELKLTGLSNEQAEARADFERKSAIDKTEIILGEYTTLYGALGQFNEKAFRAYKAFAIAEAIVSTYKGAAKAIGSYPPPFNFVAAAAVVAGGLAQVAQIKAQNFSGRRFGGSVGAGQTYMVGEAGPELFTAPAGGGSIIPNGQMGQSVNVNFTVNAIDSQSFQDSLAEQRDTIVGIINEAVHDNGRRAIV